MASKNDNITPEKAFGRVVKELRLRKGLSQQSLSFESDMDRTYVSLLERGMRRPTLNTILNLAKALDTTGPELVKKTVNLIAKSE